MIAPRRAAGDGQRPHAICPHVAEVIGSNMIFIAGNCFRILSILLDQIRKK
jgi:hypothetical protein